MFGKKDKKPKETFEDRLKRYETEMTAMQDQLNNAGNGECAVEDKPIEAEFKPVEEPVKPAKKQKNNNGNGHKSIDPVADTVPLPVDNAPVPATASAVDEQKRKDNEALQMAVKEQLKYDKEKDIAGINVIIGPDDEKLKELTNITDDQSFIYSVMDMQCAIFENANNARNDDNKQILLMQVLKNNNMRYRKSINGEGIVQALKAMEYKTTAQAQGNGLNLFSPRNNNS